MNQDAASPAPVDVAARLYHAVSCVDEPENPLPPLSLETLPHSLRQAAAHAGWRALMPVQERALPYLLQGRDIMVQSRTGSGKTGAFLLPALERLDPEQHACQCLILTPTRELAIQVEQDAQTLFQESSLKAAAVYGGVGYKRQMDALKSGVQLLVGTPGRVLDHLLRHCLNLESLKMLVFDEADRMLSIGFYPDMKAIQRYLPQRHVSTYFFSATFPPHVLRLAGEFMENPGLLSLSSKEVHVSQMEHVYYQVKPMEKDRVLVRVLEMESPAAAIVFCNTKADVHYIAGVLRGFGFNADELSADLSQSRREEVLLRVRRGEVRFLVATDVAARGLDIPELSHVILYQPPEDHESYIHRAGRTARAGAGGTVISLVDVMQKMELTRIAKQYGIQLQERTAPDDAALSTVVGERLTTILESRLRQATGLVRERSRRFLPLVRELAAEEDFQALLALLLDEAYQAGLHSPVTAFPPENGNRSAAKSQDSGQRSNRKKRPGRKKPRAEPGALSESTAIERQDVSETSVAQDHPAPDSSVPHQAAVQPAEAPEGPTALPKKPRSRRRRSEPSVSPMAPSQEEKTSHDD